MPNIVAPINGLFDSKTGRLVGIAGESPRAAPLQTSVLTSIGGVPPAESAAIISPAAGSLSGGRYLACLPMTAASVTQGTAQDVSGAGGRGVLFGLTPAQAWTNAGYFTTYTVGNDGYMFIESYKTWAQSLSQAELNRKVIVLSMVIKTAQPGGGASNSFGAATGGPFGRLRGTVNPGAMQVGFGDSGGQHFVSSYANSGVVADGTDHTLGIVYDMATRRVYQFCDGRLTAVHTDAIQAAVVPANVTEFCIGELNVDFVTPKTAGVFQVRGFHLIALDQMPTNIQQIMGTLHRVPDAPLRYTDVAMPTKRVVIAGAGQSNLVGYGSTDRSTAGAGEPIFDPVPPNGTGRTGMLPMITEALAGQGIYATMLNTAVGSTSIAEQWTGRLRTWASGMKAGLGGYVLSDGSVWKIVAQPTTGAITTTSALSAVFSVGATAPTGTSNVAATGTTPGYTYLGAATSADVAGTVYTSGNARFDPNGYVANAVAALNACDSSIQRVLMVQFGESDSDMRTTAAEYRAALVALSSVFVGIGCKVLIGQSNYTDPADPPAVANVNTALLPGRALALSDLAGTGAVFAGADLATGLGLLLRANYSQTARPDNNTSGLLNEGGTGIYVHMNDKAIRSSAPAWVNAIAASLA